MKCPYGFEENESGCRICRCRDPSEPGAVDTFTRPRLASRDCEWNNLKKKEGEMWQSGCYVCFCYSGGGGEVGTVMCSLRKCANLANCKKPRFIEGHCCPICDEEYGSLLVGDSDDGWTMKCSDVGLVMGEVWLPEQNQVDEDNWSCRVCGCMASFVMCAYNVCPPVTCPDPQPLPGSCCLGCPEIEPKGEKGCIDEHQQSILSRESWQADQCKTCKCEDGDISCISQECHKDTECDMLVLQQGECCPICLDYHPQDNCVDPATGQEYRTGSQWNRDSCTECTCIQGKHKCFTEICTVQEVCPSGAKPIHVDGYCCEVCPTTMMGEVEKGPLCYTTMCRATVGMLTLLVLLTILSIIVCCYVTKSNKSDFVEPVIPRPTPMPRLSDSQPNLSVTRSPAIGKYIAGEKRPDSRVTTIGYARDPSSVSQVHLNLIGGATSYNSLLSNTPILHPKYSTHSQYHPPPSRCDDFPKMSTTTAPELRKLNSYN